MWIDFRFNEKDYENNKSEIASCGRDPGAVISIAFNPSIVQRIVFSLVDILGMISIINVIGNC